MRAAAIDIGSNSIKLLVAERRADGSLDEVVSRTLEVRIGAGIASVPPRLTRDGIENGIAAVAELVAEIGRMGAQRIGIVATSAVRDASNGLEFRDRVKGACGHEVRILTGIEEANLIGRGLATDPASVGPRVTSTSSTSEAAASSASLSATARPRWGSAFPLGACA